MDFDLKKSIEILERTPSVISTLLSGLSDDWISQNEGENTWSPYDVVGHLIHGEKTDWVPRVEIILKKEHRAFTSFNRFAQFEDSKGKSLHDLLQEFAKLRKINLEKIEHLKLTDKELVMEGTHPELGMVTLKNLLATWVAHDLGHISQITRVMAKQYTSEVGVWHQYLGILK